MSNLVNNFIQISSKKTLDEYNNDALCQIASLSNSNGVYLFFFDWDNEFVILKNEWIRNEHYTLKNDYNRIPFSDISSCYINNIKEGNSFLVNSPDEILKNYIYKQEVISICKQQILILPFKNDNHILGALAFYRTKIKKRLSKKNLSTINILCEMISLALQKTDNEKRLARQNENMQLLLDSTNDGIGMLSKDGVVLNANSQFAKRFNKNPDEMIGLNTRDLLPESRYGDLHEQRTQKIRDVFSTKKPYIFEDSRDGLLFFNRFYPVFKGCEVIAVTLISTDITYRRQLEEKEKEILKLTVQTDELKKKEEEYLDILDSSTEGSYIVDFVKGTARYSEKWTKRLGLENVPPEQLLDLVHQRMPFDEAETSVKIRYDVEIDRIPNLRRIIRIKDKDDKIMWVMLQGKLIYNKEGKLIKTYGAFFDITELKELELELIKQKNEIIEKDKLITDFFINISHEFKTPLSILLMKLEELDSGWDQGRNCCDIQNIVTIMQQHAFRLMRLIGNLLDITKIEAGFESVNLIMDDFVRTLRELTESIVDYASKKGIKVTFSSNMAHKIIPFDKDKTERILLNLLSNAIKNTPEGGNINVMVEVADKCVNIDVKDDGVGIPLEKQDIIFDRFRQVDSSFTRKSEGCGIGLSLTKGLVELLKGEIKVKSKPECGSVFSVRLPVLELNKQAGTIIFESLTLKKKIEIEFSDLN